MSQSDHVMGGEFEISVLNVMNNDRIKEEGFFYSSGRAALYNILLYIKSRLGRNRLLLPDYLCLSIINIIEVLGLRYSFYKINEDLSIDNTSVCRLYDQQSMLLFINYFGLIDCSRVVREMRYIDTEMLIVQDNVQAYFDMSNDSGADFIFTSLRKSLPLPDGGWVKTKYLDMHTYDQFNKFSMYKLAGSILKTFRDLNGIDDEVYLELLSKGEDMIDSDYQTMMSGVTHSLYNRLELSSFAIKRKANANFLKDRLSCIGIKSIVEYHENVVPLFLPIRLINRDVIRKKMFENHIFCPVHWPLPADSRLERGGELFRNELSLIVDHRYGVNEMIRMIEVIEQNI